MSVESERGDAFVVTPERAQAPTNSRAFSANAAGELSPSALAALLEGLPNAALVFSADGTLQAMNRAARAFAIVDALAPITSQRVDVVLARVSDVAIPLYHRVRQGERLSAETHFSVELERWLDVHVTPMPAAMLLVTIADMTDREMQRARLVRVERELEALLSLSASSVRIADAHGRIVRTNEIAAAEHDDASPATLRALWERDQPHHLDEDIAIPFASTIAMRALAGLTVRRETATVRRNANREPRVIESSAMPIVDESRAVIGAVIIERDVTASQFLERTLDQEVLRSAELESLVLTEADRIEQIVEERARALAKREEATSRDRRLSAIGQLAAGVMHDVNNALNPIMAAAYLLRHHAESPDAVRDYADRIKKAAETGAATASRVGRFIRQEPLHPGTDELLDLSALVDEVLELTEPMRQRRASERPEVTVTRDYDDDARIRGLSGEIREALFNLVANSMDAMPAGGTLSVRTGVEFGDAIVTVADDGVGMTDEVRERAFEPFFTTKGAGGSGLGLAEVYGIARRHRGSVTISSAPGAGAAVTMRFPLDLSRSVAAVVEEPDAKTDPKHILVVEDHEDGREFLRRLLRAAGHTVDAVGSCAEARERLASPSALLYHVMLTDVGLPDGSGWDLVTYVRTRFPALRVGVITGWEPMVSGDDALGAEFVMRKPLRAAELLSYIAGRKLPAQPK